MIIGEKLPLVGIVGPCGSGKTTLISSLKPYGVRARHIAQEHSYVANMWQRVTNPDFLVFLDASHSETIRRRKLNWTIEEYQEQQRRLEHARQNAHLYINTDLLRPEQVVDQVVQFLQSQGYPVSS